MRRAAPPGVMVAVLAGMFVASPAGAQSWRTLDVARQLSGDSARPAAGEARPVAVRVTYGAGKLGLYGVDAPLLYEMRLRYDAERATPMHRFDSESRELRLGIHGSSVRLARRSDAGEMRLGLSRGVPLDLALELGAVQADLDLSGLAVTSLKLASGASDATVHFDAANPARMQRLELTVGAAGFHATGLANANAPEVVVTAGVGDVDLDFGGEWRQDVDLRVTVALGAVTVRVPPDVGVWVEPRGFLASFEHAGLLRRGDSYVTSNYDAARHKLRIRSSTTFGTFGIEQAALARN